MTSPSLVEEAIKYARDVAAKRIVAGTYVRKQCKLFLDDLDTRQRRDDFRWRFDVDAANHVLTYVQLLTFVEGPEAGTPIRLQPWQAFILACLYGWRDATNPAIRRYTSAIVLVARKNGKSTLLGALALYELMFAPEGSQLVCMATQREQARVVWNMSDRMRLVSDPRLTDGITKTVQSISNINNWSRYTPLSKESKRLDGLNIRLAIADEAAAIDNANLFEVVTSSMGNQVSPQTVMITTGQPGAKSNYFYQQLDYAKKVLDGLIDDQRIFTLAYQIDEHDDWKEPKNWLKANPNLGVSVQQSFLLEELMKAEEVPSLAANFRTKYCNEFISTSSAWISTDRWKESAVESIRTDLPLYVGLDLGSTSDLTAVGQVFAGDDEFHFRAKCFLPEEAFINAPKHVRQVYDLGVQSGSLVITEGDIADHQVIRDYILSLNNDYDLREVAFDPWSATNLSSTLQESGLTMVKFAQSMGAMSPASKDTELLIRTGKLLHEDDPFFQWQLGNCEVYTDVNGNIKVRKGNDQALKIDAIVGMIMAVGRATAHGARKKEKVFDFYIG